MDYAHGGLPRTSELVEKDPIWIKWVRATMTWPAARAHCVSLGGQLFHNFDGTAAQLVWLATKVKDGQGFSWLGGYSYDYVTWYNVYNQVINPSVLLWSAGQPDRIGEFHLHLLPNARLNNVIQTVSSESICDLLA